MTAVVYSAKEGIVVTDKRTTCGILTYEKAVKVVRGIDFFAAYAGSMNVVQRFFQGLHDSEDLFDGINVACRYKDVFGNHEHIDECFNDSDKACEMLVFFKIGDKIHLRSFCSHANTFVPEPVDADCHLGSGTYHTQMAMECGKNAREAVELASKYTYTVGFATDTYNIEAELTRPAAG